MTMYAYLGAMIVGTGIAIGVQEKWVKPVDDDPVYKELV